MTPQASGIEAARMQRLHEASDWLLRLNDERCSEEDTAEWLRWCDADRENLDAFESLQRDWLDLDALKRTHESSHAAAATPTWKSPRWRWGIAAAFAFALVVGSAAGYWMIEREPAQRLAASHVNKVATLPDGSSLVLSAKTLVDVDFTGPERHLNLSEGLAYFKVRHDVSRPFVVEVGEVSVTAVGTAFDVRREKDRVIVTVEEGVVEVASRPHSGAAQPGVWRAEAGYRLAYSTRERTAIIASVDPSTALKWRTGELAYVWEPLGSVVADVNRYSSRPIVLHDQRVASLRFTGTVFTASIDDWLQAIQSAYPLRVVEGANGEIVLEPT
jgi:transmembrane sensor